MPEVKVEVPSDPALTEYWSNFQLKTLARVNLSFMPLYDMIERNGISFGDMASFGAGSCTHETAIALIWPTAQVHCFDVTDSYIPDYTKRVFEERPNLRFREWDATKPVDEKFDLVISIQTLEHIADYAAALATLVRALRPGGYIYVDTPQFHEHEELEPRLSELWDRARNVHHHEHLGFSGLQMRRRLEAHGLDIVDSGFYSYRRGDEAVMRRWREGDSGKATPAEIEQLNTELIRELRRCEDEYADRHAEVDQCLIRDRIANAQRVLARAPGA